MTEESLDDPTRETHAHFDGLLRLLAASALQITDRRAQRRLNGTHPDRSGSNVTGSDLVNTNEAMSSIRRTKEARQAVEAEHA